MNAITSNECAGCNTFRADRHLDAVTVSGDTYYACEDCSEALAGPGKHEAVSEDDHPLAVVLESLRLVSGEDHYLTDDWQGYVGVFGEHVLLEDGQGFVEVRSFRTHEDAMREANSYEDDGFGASDEDAYIGYSRGGLDVQFAGKHEGTYETLSRARAAVSVAMRREGYFPNVWLTGEHGPTIRRIDVW